MFAGASSSSTSPASGQSQAPPQRSIPKTTGMSRFSLRDDGPMSSHSAANLQQRQSQQSLNSHFDPETPRPAYLTAFGDDLRSTRSSVVSLQELEHGWGSNVAALNSANKGGIPETHSNRPPANGTQPAQRAYRPIFAPNADPFQDAQSTQQAPPEVSFDSRPAGHSPKRGRSIKERITGALGRSKSMDPSTKYSNPTRPGQGIRTESSTSKDLAHDTSNNELSFCEVAVEDDDAPPLSTNGSKSKDFSQGVMRRLSRHGTRKAKPEVPPKPPQEEIDNIELYAAPATAGIKNPPMLSSYAPRPALRPRANTDGAATMLKPTKSITVGQARLAYAKSVSRNKRTSGAAPNGTSTSATRPDTSTPPAYRRTANASSDTINQEDVLSMNNPRQSTASRRKSRQVPEGWGTSSDILETSKSGENKQSVKTGTVV